MSWCGILTCEKFYCVCLCFSVCSWTLKYESERAVGGAMSVVSVWDMVGII